jgi:hypothetical protein
LATIKKANFDPIWPFVAQDLEGISILNLVTVVPAKGERLYRTVGGISGLRGLKLRHGSLIALTEEEAAPLVTSGALELAEPVPATE